MNLKKELTINFLIIGGTLTLAGIILYFLIAELNLQAGKTRDTKMAIEGTAAAVDFLSRYKEGKTAADKYDNVIKLLLPAQDELLQFPQWLENLALSKRLEAKVSFDGNPVLPEKDPGYINFNLTLDGSMGTLNEFMGLIEGNRDQYLIQLSSISFSKAEGGRYRFFAKGKVFFRQ